MSSIRPNPVFSDGAVLQRGVRVPVWGTGTEGEQVTVSFQDQWVSTSVKDGRWKVILKPMSAGGPYTMVIQGSNTITLNDILVGDVWLASGQSNMEWALANSFEPAEDIAAAEDPELRLLTVPRKISDAPQQEADIRWARCSPKTVPGFSAVAYYFARELRRTQGVAIGIISSAYGGTVCEAWTNPAALKQVESLTYLASRHPVFDPANANATGVLYNGMIHPVIPYALRGFIWYQGESNGDRGYEYRTLFPAMIANWRKEWGLGDLPFLFVQLAPYFEKKDDPGPSYWAELREAQLLTSQRVKNTAMAVITDYGDEQDIHPPWKKPVGERLALAARALAYGEKIPYNGPIFKGMGIQENKIVLEFDHTYGGLVSGDGKLAGFTVAGDDRVFHKAEALLEDNRVIAWSDEVAKPVAVRYGWSDYPDVNLYNGAGLPASPFRTDDWPLLSGPKE